MFGNGLEGINDMVKAIFITVRSDSSRLPNKAFLEILGKSTLELVILRAKQVKNADVIVVCTSDRPTDDKIEKLAQNCGVKCFRGSLEDKLDRWLNAAKKFHVDFFVTLDGDDLLCEPELLELGIKQLNDEKVDFIEAPVGLICGAFTYGIKVSALERVCDIKGTCDTEMMWVYFKDTGLFKVATLNVEDSIFFDSSIRMTLDYIEDFNFFKAIFEHFNCINNNVSLRVIVPFLKKNPDIVSLNAFRHLDWSNNQQKKTKLILKKNYENRQYE
jgi:spore coat polysaccharide biosynthesis protein SpsF